MEHLAIENDFPLALRAPPQSTHAPPHNPLYVPGGCGYHYNVTATGPIRAGRLKAAREARIELWDFREILREIASHARTVRTYFSDDTMRTLQLMAMATD